MIIPSVSHDLRGGVSAPIMARPNCSNGDDVGGGNDGDGVQVEVEEEVGCDDDDGDEETDDTLVHLLTLSGYQCS